MLHAPFFHVSSMGSRRMTTYTSSGTFQCSLAERNSQLGILKKSGLIFLSLQLADCMNGYQATAPRAAGIEVSSTKTSCKANFKWKPSKHSQTLNLNNSNEHGVSRHTNTHSAIQMLLLHYL